MIEHDTFLPSIEINPLNKTISDAVDILRGQAKLQGVEISLETLPREIYVKMDYLRVQQVIINLVSNAIKFTPP